MRPYQEEQARTPYRYRLVLDQRRSRVSTYRDWFPGDPGAYPPDRDREDPIDNLIATELAGLGWKEGRSAIMWLFVVLAAAGAIAGITAIVLIAIAFLT